MNKDWPWNDTQNEFSRIQEAIKLAMKWLRQEQEHGGYFMPDLESDKIARTRTGACARELLEVLSGKTAYSSD